MAGDLGAMHDPSCVDCGQDRNFPKVQKETSSVVGYLVKLSKGLLHKRKTRWFVVRANFLNQRQRCQFFV